MVSKSLKIDKNSKVILKPDIIIRKEKDFYILGRKIGSSIRTTKDGIEIIKHLGKKMSLNEIYNIMKEEYTFSALKGFVKLLLYNGFIEKVDDKKIPELFHVKKQLPFLTKERVKWLFSPFSFFIWLLIVIFSIIITSTNTFLFPSWSDFFVTGQYSIDIVLMFFTSIFLVSFHELFHITAARSLDLEPVIGLTNRYNYLVATTNIQSLWVIPRNQRYRVLLSGIMNDIFIASLIIIILWLSSLGKISLPLFIIGLFRLVVLIEFLNIAWQFLFFFKTDIYYTIENLFQTPNLAENSGRFLKSLFSKVKPVFFSQRERKITIIYTVIAILGVIVNFYIFIKYQLVIMIEIVTSVVKAFLGLMPLSQYADSLVVLLILFINQYFFNKAFVRHHKLYKKRDARIFFKIVNTVIIILIILLLGSIFSLI